MSAEKIVVIRCDGADVDPENTRGGAFGELAGLRACRATFQDPDGIQGNTDVRRAARKAGWKVGSWDYCPEHARLAQR